MTAPRGGENGEGRATGDAPCRLPPTDDNRRITNGGAQTRSKPLPNPQPKSRKA